MKDSFFDLLSRLVMADVDFVIVGGFAGVVYGCTYVTQDIDICCDFSAPNLFRLREALCEVHPVHRMTPKRQPFEVTEENCSQYKNLYLDTDIGRLDCLSVIDGIGDYRKAREKAVPIEVENIRIYVLSLDALIKAKKTMGRPRDKEAVLQLEVIKKMKNRTES